MIWRHNDLDALFEAAPEATILGYAGHLSDNTGRIVLVADRGRAANPNDVLIWAEDIGGSNIVDVPAIQILARMPRPRLWVSDGGVTGEGDQLSSRVVDAVAALVAEAGIMRMTTGAKGAAEMFK
jgi:hypothetical protein